MLTMIAGVMPLEIGAANNIEGKGKCMILRKETKIPIIMLTAKGEENDRVLGFDLGADDYVVKLFSPREL